MRVDCNWPNTLSYRRRYNLTKLVSLVLGKMERDTSLEDVARAYGFAPLAITIAHADAVRLLPRHHRDPFARLLIAQAKLESLVLLINDATVKLYDATAWE